MERRAEKRRRYGWFRGDQNGAVHRGGKQRKRPCWLGTSTRCSLCIQRMDEGLIGGRNGGARSDSNLKDSTTEEILHAPSCFIIITMA